MGSPPPRRLHRLLGRPCPGTRASRGLWPLGSDRLEATPGTSEPKGSRGQAAGRQGGVAAEAAQSRGAWGAKPPGALTRRPWCRRVTQLRIGTWTWGSCPVVGKCSVTGDFLQTISIVRDCEGEGNRGIINNLTTGPRFLFSS